MKAILKPVGFADVFVYDLNNVGLYTNKNTREVQVRGVRNPEWTPRSEEDDEDGPPKYLKEIATHFLPNGWTITYED